MVSERTVGTWAMLPICILLLSLATIANTQSATVVIEPLSLVASLDQDGFGVFRCTANGSGTPVVEIDDQPSTNQDISERGIIATTEGVTTIDYTIMIPATEINNDTRIQCQLFIMEGDSLMLQESRVAKFYVQGLLEAPATEIVAVNDSFLLFTWSPPFSLDITDSDPDIISYSFTESLTPSDTNVSAVLEFVFPVLAVPVEFTVSAWNIVGEGQRAIATHQPCSLSEEEQMVSSAGVSSEVIYEESGGASLSLSFPWPTNCFPLFTLELAEADNEGDGEVVKHERLLPRVTSSGGEREVHLSVPLQERENTLYTAQLISITDERAIPTQDKLKYSTHDVQLVQINFTPNSITTYCQFAIGSLALGCSVHITRENDVAPLKMLKVMRESNTSDSGLPLSVEVTADGLESGVYTVAVYDIERNGETRTNETPAHVEMVDITEPTKPTEISVSTDPSSSPTDIVITDPLNPEQNAQSNNAVPIIAGAIVAGVLLIALVLLILVSVTIWGMRRKREKIAEEAESREREFVLISTGATISSESVAATHLNPTHTLQVSSSSSPSHTLPGSASSLQKNNLTKDTLPPAYSDLEANKHIHVRSMSDVVTTQSSVGVVSEGDMAEGVASPIDESDTNAQTGTQKKAVEATLSAPLTSPPPTLSQTRSDSVTPLSTSHAHLMRHERSSSLGGPYPSHPLQTHTFSVPPPHPPKKISNPKKHRAPPAPSFSTSALLPPLFITPPPLSLPTSSHSLEGTPTGPEGLSLGENRPTIGANPLYDTTAALQLKAEEKKRRSIHYTEVVPRTQSALATPIDPAFPHDREAVLYSELNVEQLVPRLPSKRTHTVPASQLEAAHRPHF